MNKKRDYFNTICMITNAIGSTTKYEDLLDLVVTSAVDAMDAKGASLFLPSDDDEFFVPVVNKGLSENYLHANPIRVQPIIDKLLSSGGHLAVKDATTDTRIPNHQAKIDEGIASLLSVPIMVKDNFRGVLTLYTSETRDFLPEDVTLLKTLASQGGIAIERAKLIRRIFKYIQMFRNISENINSSLDIKQVLNTLSCDTCEALEMKGSLIRLKDENTGELKLVASCGLSDAFLDKGPVYTEKGYISVMKGETLVVEDVSSSELIQYPEELQKEGIASILSVPVKTKNHVIGVLNLNSSRKTDFSNGVIDVAQAVGIQGGIAIHNASAYLKLNETKESLEQDIWGYRSWF
ncbi:MAG: GAF domain-containing protein [Desulfotignum sp.]